MKERSYYEEKYGAPFFSLDVVRELLLRQRNRGQDAVGVASCILPTDREIAKEYFYVDKMLGNLGIEELFAQLTYEPACGTSGLELRSQAKLFIGHTLYSTLLDEPDIRYAHPVQKFSGVPAQRLALAMNGNFANNEEQRRFLISLGQFPTSLSDIQTLTEAFGYFLDKQLEGGPSDPHLCMVMKNVHVQLKGGYAISGMTGDGYGFMIRDPHGIRPAYYSINDEFAVGASEIGAITVALGKYGLSASSINELPPGHILIVDPEGNSSLEQYSRKTEYLPCMLESVYFSRVESPGMYTRRKRLGRGLVQQVHGTLQALGNRNVTVSYVPNSAEPAALGLYHGLLELEGKSDAAANALEVKFENTITKDTKLRTFIAPSDKRSGLISSTYSLIEDSVDQFDGHSLVLVEDSIIKGSTLQQRIVSLLIAAGCRTLLIVSSCPQLRYPCPYGVEISSLGQLIAFRAAISLVSKKGMQARLEEIRKNAQEQQQVIDVDPQYVPKNLVREIYDISTFEEISGEIAEQLRPDDWDGELQVVFPQLEEFRHTLDHSHSDSCISGGYPEIGGHRVLNKALVNYFEKLNTKAY